MNNPIIETKSAGGVVVNTQGQILVVSQKGRSWSLPKGKVEMGESLLEAAHREILEETGVSQLDYKCIIGTYRRPKMGAANQDNPFESKLITIYLFATDQMDLNPIDPENPEARWVDIHKVANLLTHPLDRQFFENAIPKVAHYFKVA